MTGVVVLASGGIDSAALLAGLAAPGVWALGVDYGQRHFRELQYAERQAARLGVPFEVARVKLPFTCALTDPQATLPTGIATGQDETYVPGRNTILVALAAGYAQQVGATAVAIGCNADDAVAYPDCRREWVAATSRVLQLGYGVELWAPNLAANKAAILQTAVRLGVAPGETYSCYHGGPIPCGMCGACTLRARAGA